MTFYPVPLAAFEASTSRTISIPFPSFEVQKHFPQLIIVGIERMLQRCFPA